MMTENYLINEIQLILLLFQFKRLIYYILELQHIR
jgi:hypothetical protein